MSRPSRKSLTPESLVSVLVPHITQQTLLLPTLHTQLGLPPSALESDLCALREALLKTVEECVETRKREIVKWEEKCEAVELRCRRLENALGRRAASLAEIKKVEIYPTRYEQLSAQEEKLHQLYNSKLEQLNTLTNRLHHLSSTLGSTFFSDDILHPSPAPGEVEAFKKREEIQDGDPQGFDEEDERLLRDVAPERFNRLEKELVRGKSEIGRRLVSLSGLFEQIAWLYTELGILLPTPADPIPSSTEFPYPRPYQSKVAAKMDPFVVAPAPDPRRQRAEYFPIFAAYVGKLQEAMEEGRDPGGVEGVDPTQMLVEWFERLKVDLEEEKTHREAHIQTLYDQLEVLWKRMGITDEDIDDFVELNRGSSTDNVRAYELELERMLEMKREKMSMFIGNARVEIEQLWDDLMFSEEEREVFAAFHDDEHSEDLLTIHEEEIVKLKNERRSKAPILVSIRKYYQICEEQKQLEISASDQSRLLGRGTRGDPGRLLREEKMRKRVVKEKPKLEQELLISVPHWEEENGKPLLVNGIHFMGVLQEAVRVEEAKADTKKRQRTNSTVGRSITPGPGSNPPSNAHSRKASVALSIAPSLRSASGSSHASSALSISTNSTTSSVLGPASKRQKLNNAHPRNVQSTVAAEHSSTGPIHVSSTVVGSTTRSTRSTGQPQRPGSRQGVSRTGSTTPLPLEGTTPTAQGKTFPHGGPGRAPSRLGMGGRAPSPSKLSTVSTISLPPAPSKVALAPSSQSNKTKALVFPAVAGNINEKVAALVSGGNRSDSSSADKEDKVAGRSKGRKSFKPRPSSPGIGREYADMWRGKRTLHDEALSGDSDAEL